jgi:hypothetical protein
MPGLREQGDQKALRIKACWTEPLLTRAKLVSSMGIVKLWDRLRRVYFEC